MSSATFAVYGFAVALGLGVGSAYWILERDYPIGSVRAGPWIAWPQVGSRGIDPYARAIVARRGEIPLALGEGLALRAAVDDAGEPLRSLCAYRLGSVTPQARLWSLTLYDEAGRLRRSDLERSGFTSAEILREGDGRFQLTLSRDARSGNWLKTPDTERFVVVLRLYDTPVAAGSSALDARTLPAIERLECRA